MFLERKKNPLCRAMVKNYTFNTGVLIKQLVRKGLK